MSTTEVSSHSWQTPEFLALERVLDSRRSVRRFDGTALPEEAVHRALDAAVLAASSSNMQPWEFVWVRDPAQKAELAKACLNQTAARSAGDLIAILAHTHTWDRNRKLMIEHLDKLAAEGTKVPRPVTEYYHKLVPLAYGMSLPLRIFKHFYLRIRAMKEPMAREPISRGDLRVWAVKSTALAAQNLMIAFRAQGFDSCPMEGFDRKRVGKLLGLSRRTYVVMVLAVGRRRDDEVTLPRFRIPRELVVRRV